MVMLNPHPDMGKFMSEYFRSVSYLEPWIYEDNNAAVVSEVRKPVSLLSIFAVPDLGLPEYLALFLWVQIPGVVKKCLVPGCKDSEYWGG